MSVFAVLGNQTQKNKKEHSSGSSDVNPGMLLEFRKSQSLAYGCAIEIAQLLRVGWTEKKTAKMMDQWLGDHGVRSFFHKSFAWFGDRTRFQGFKHYTDFLPSKRVLSEDDVIILDTAPIFNGYTSDIGFTFALKPNEALNQARADLLYFRDLIPKLFMKSECLGEVWRAVDFELVRMQYDNCHAEYPFGVLGHRIHQIPLSRFPGLSVPFSVHAFWSLLSRGLMPELLSENHRGKKEGLWAIEPHLGTQGFGIKFEEILVVDDNGARWLTDDVPHLNIPSGLY